MIQLLCVHSSTLKIRYYASPEVSPGKSGACGAVITNNKQRYCHSRESGNPAGVNRSSCIFWIPVFTGITVVVVYRSNLQKIVSHATLRAYVAYEILFCKMARANKRRNYWQQNPCTGCGLQALTPVGIMFLLEKEAGPMRMYGWNHCSKATVFWRIFRAEFFFSWHWDAKL